MDFGYNVAIVEFTGCLEELTHRIHEWVPVKVVCICDKTKSRRTH